MVTDLINKQIVFDQPQSALPVIHPDGVEFLFSLIQVMGKAQK
jgi:hypothetical protein